MNTKSKKIVLILLASFLFLILSLAVTPYLFKDKIIVLAKKELNNMLVAKVDFSSVKLSLFKNFPHLSVSLIDLSVVGVERFEQDTLFYSKDFLMVVNLKSLFQDTGYDIQRIEVNQGLLGLKVLSDGRANWDIMSPDSLATEDTTSMSFHMKLKDVKIKNSTIKYVDEEGGGMAVYLYGVNHHLSGDFTADSSLLVTRTTAESFTFIMDGVPYISKAKAVFNADLNANLNDMAFVFSKNESYLNEVPFSFEGGFKSIDNGWALDMSLVANKINFKSLLSLVPQVYATNFNSLQADGKVSLSGYLKGEMVGDYYPSFGLNLLVEQAWFSYPDLPEKLTDINIKANIENKSNVLDATVIDVSRFAFNMAGNPFALSLRITNPITDPNINFFAKGKLNLGAVKNFYPFDKGVELAGMIEMDMTLAGRMSYYEKNLYDKFNFAGHLLVNNLQLKYPSLPQDLKIETAKAVFNNRYLELETLKMDIGRNNVKAQGRLENVVAYALKDQTLVGQLSMESAYFNASDFMPEDTTEPTQDSEPMSVIVIPTNIQFRFTANFDELWYEKMHFTNAKGLLLVSDGKLSIQNMSLNAFGGSMIMNGLYDTQNPQQPKVDFTLQIKEVAFIEISKQMELFTQFAPILQNALGKFSTTITFNSLLKKDMMPDLSTFMGNGQLSTSSVGLQGVPVLNSIATSLKREDLVPMVIRDLGLVFEIKEGKLHTKPFQFKVKDVQFNIGGITGLDQTINYQGNVTLPDKLNLGKLSNMAIQIGGTFKQPKVKLDLLSTLNTIIDDKKQEIKAQATEKVDEAKEKALEDARIRRAKALEQAKIEADRLKNEAKLAGERLVAEADNKGKLLISQANNPIAKRAAEVTAREMVREAQKQADNINKKAEEEAKRLLQKAEQSTEF